MEHLHSSLSPASPEPDGALARGVEQIGSAAHQTIDKVAQPARATVERVSASAHETVDRIVDNANDAAHRLEDRARRVRDLPARAVARSGDYVRDRPLQAVGLALAAGFIIGRLTAWRR